MDDDNSTLAAKVKTARTIVDRIIQICTGYESDAWMVKFIAVRDALAEERFRDAVREESKLTCYDIRRKWVISMQLEMLLERAMGMVHRHLSYPGRFEEGLVLGDLPADVTIEGTHAEATERVQRAAERLYAGHPLDTDPEYADIMGQASRRAADELALEGVRPTLGYCHVFWQRKKEILQREFGLDWKSPAELHPGVRFD